MRLFGLFEPPNVEKLKGNKDVNGLIKVLGYKKDVKVRNAAVEALGQIGDSRAVVPLIAVLEEGGVENRQRRASAATALGQIGDSRAIESLAVALDEWGVNGPAAEALIKIGDPSVLEAVISVMLTRHILNLDNPIKVLCAFGRAAVEPVSALLKDKYCENRLAAAYVLGEVGGPRAVNSLIDLLQDDEGFVRARAARSLGQLGDFRAVEPLIAILPDIYPGVNERVIEALVSIRDPSAVEPLITRFRDETWIVRKQVAEAVAKFGEAAIVMLIPMLKQNDVNVQTTAANSLVEIGSPAVAPLIAVLSDEDKFARKAAAESLGKIGDPRAIDPLTAALQDVAEDVRVNAAEALRKISEKREQSEVRQEKEKSEEDSTKRRVRALLEDLPLIAEENITEYRQRIIHFSRPPHPCIMSGSVDEVTDFVAKSVRATESYIHSCKGIRSIKSAFLISSLPVRDVLEIQYEQFWDNGTSSIYSEHVARTGDDQFEVFGEDRKETPSHPHVA